MKRVCNHVIILPPSRSDFEEPIPDDRYHGIYFAMLLAGVGFLLPYNSFITDVDYLHHKFQGTNAGARPPARQTLAAQGSRLLCAFQGRRSCST